MVVVTHEMGFARQVADRIAFIDEGQIVEIARRRLSSATRGTSEPRCSSRGFCASPRHCERSEATQRFREATSWPAKRR